MPAFLSLTRVLIGINIVVFCLQQLSGDLLVIYGALWPLNAGAAGAPPFEPWQLITYGFLHGGWFHLLFNMWALYIFGEDLERFLGVKRYAGLYFTSVLTAALTQLAFSWFAGLPPYPTVGASGAVFGVLLGFAMFFPERRILLIIPPIPMPARVFVVLYAALELFLGVTGSQEGVAHFAHLGGLVGALLFLYKPGRRR
jgi:membrane associated rhomboid family serine protease